MVTLPEAPAPAEPIFEVDSPPEDGVLRLARELRRFDRARAGARGAEFPHDESYAPGYHEGGTRFGFFSGNDETESPSNTPPPAATPAKPEGKG